MDKSFIEIMGVRYMEAWPGRNLCKMMRIFKASEDWEPMLIRKDLGNAAD